jgi:D-cysteine desulfhydrase family pyridoxal phosphate-dependent enzyme
MAGLHEIPRVSLVPEPTPLHALPRLSETLGGVQVWCKRDDLTRLALGGNKLRKLEFLLRDALDQEADIVITTGPTQSNHCRLTAAAAASLGLKSLLVLRKPVVAPAQGNLLLDDLIGAEVRFGSWDTWEEGHALLEKVAEAVRAAGHRPYIVPLGGSNALGTLGYVLGALEIAQQAGAMGLEPRAILCATSSGSTQAGLALAKEIFGLPFDVIGISVSPAADPAAAAVAELASAAAELLGADPVPPDKITVRDEYIGPGYGQVDARTVEAIRTVARLEGIMLDPVYTGKVMAGLIDLAQQDTWSKDELVIFLHTGGLPALFAYGDPLGVKTGLARK